MLVDRTEGYLESVRAFADATNRREQLEKELDYLANYSNNTKCELFKDFAPQSFYFIMYKGNSAGEYRRWFNGGLIFHGSHDGGGVNGSAPTFATCLQPTDGWSIHT